MNNMVRMSMKDIDNIFAMLRQLRIFLFFLFKIRRSNGSTRMQYNNIAQPHA